MSLLIWSRQREERIEDGKHEIEEIYDDNENCFEKKTDQNNQCQNKSDGKEKGGKDQ